MSYQVLARKWRPRTFQDMVGQEHVLKALVHALDRQRLHHAYLFTGTRGVGKTTIGRLLARCLNCETGITSQPCGECDSCRELLEGRFVDLIEIDAASRTKVEDMRELLDNVPYSPTRGRFKIYLIDEVHMLSNSSFNALLKTLEEPPDHVKFLFATTDPQKVPVTILSRCLQFNLKRMTPEHIVGHLSHVLAEEQIPFEDPAVWLLARAADGSMRDALSLTDQAIAFGNEKLAASDVSTMLGTIEQGDIAQLVDALVNSDGPTLLSEINRIASLSPDYSVILSDLLSLFHRTTLEQVIPGSADNAMGDAEKVKSLARQLSAEDAQLFYQSALIGRKDLEITPDARMGFEMVLLRMLTFRPGSDRREPPAARATTESPVTDEPAPAPAAAPSSDVAAPEATAASSPTPQNVTPAPELVEDTPEPAKTSLAEKEPESQTPPEPVASEPEPAIADPVNPDVAQSPGTDTDQVPLSAYDEDIASADAGSVDDKPAPEQAPSDQPENPVPEPPADPVPAPVKDVQTTNAPPISSDAFDYSRDFPALGLSGMAGNLASQATCKKQGSRVTLTLDTGHARLLTARHQSRIAEAMSGLFDESIDLQVSEGDPGEQTPAAYAERVRQARQQAAEAEIADDPHVQTIMTRFDGSIVAGSTGPLTGAADSGR